MQPMRGPCTWGVRTLDHPPDRTGIETGAGQHRERRCRDQRPPARADGDRNLRRDPAVADHGPQQEHVRHRPMVEPLRPAEHHSRPGPLPVQLDAGQRRAEQAEAEKRQDHALQPDHKGQQRPAVDPHPDDAGAEPAAAIEPEHPDRQQCGGICRDQQDQRGEREGQGGVQATPGCPLQHLVAATAAQAAMPLQCRHALDGPAIGAGNDHDRDRNGAGVSRFQGFRPALSLVFDSRPSPL